MNFKALTYPKVVLLTGFVSLLCCSSLPALASEAAGDGHAWRPLYDQIMMYVNFGILVFLIVRFGKRPFQNFLQSKHDEVVEEIKSLEEKKEKMKAEAKETEEKVAAGDRHIQRIKSRIIEEGERVKQSIIDDAKTQGEFMIAESRKKAGSRFREARQAFRAELIDQAVAIAADRLPQALQAEDRDRMLSTFIDQVASAGQGGPHS
ncbi:MAG: ATP synthase F0 subunit B [Thermodesulfobacteriota bacterium]|nr:ATP synthase F0 subunit B [Thermodesulfobacteriota bacterium]